MEGSPRGWLLFLLGGGGGGGGWCCAGGRWGGANPRTSIAEGSVGGFGGLWDLGAFGAGLDAIGGATLRTCGFKLGAAARGKSKKGGKVKVIRGKAKRKIDPFTGLDVLS